MDQDLAQVAVAALADPVELRLATCRVLLRHQPHPGSELSSFVKGSAVADRSHDHGRDQGPHARDLPEPHACRITRGDLLLFMVQIYQLLLKILPLVPKQSEQVPHTWSEILLGVLEYLRHTLSKPGRALRKHQTALEQESTQLVDDRSSSGDQAVAHTMQRLQIKLSRRCPTMRTVNSVSAKPSIGEAMASQRRARPERKEPRRVSSNCAERVLRMRIQPRR